MPSVFVAPNFAIGAVLLMRFAAEAAAQRPECEIVDYIMIVSSTRLGHRERTAELISSAGGNVHEPIHSVRLPGLVAHQD